MWVGSAQAELHSLSCCCVLCALQTMTDVVGNPEEERRAEFYFQPWAQEAVCRYFYSKVSGPEQESLSGAQSGGLWGLFHLAILLAVPSFSCRHCW